MGHAGDPECRDLVIREAQGGSDIATEALVVGFSSQGESNGEKASEPDPT